MIKPDLTKKVVVGLAVTPTRINLIKKTLLSIINQSYKPDLIYINLPYLCIKEKKSYIIPDFLDELVNKNKNIKINRFDEDNGPANKLLPILKIEKHPETLIFTADDDIYYDKHWIRDFVNIVKDKDIIVSSTVWSLRCFLTTTKNDFLLNNLDDEMLNINCCATGAGCIFKVKHFQEFVGNTYYPKHFYFGNDLFFSLITKDVKKVRSHKQYYTHLEYGCKEDALSKSGQNVTNYARIIEDSFHIGYIDIGSIQSEIKACPFYNKYKSNYKDEALYLDKDYKYIFSRKYQNLMIVAHPDAEIIFGGNDLIHDKDWLVIFCTNDFKRLEMVKKVSKNMNYDYIILNHVDTQIKNIRFHPKVLQLIFDIIKNNNFKKIVTHNSVGEYGHPQHKLVHKMISHLVYNLDTHNLYTFYDNDKKRSSNEIIDIKSNNLKIYNRPLERWPQINYYISQKTEPNNYELKDIIFKI